MGYIPYFAGVEIHVEEIALDMLADAADEIMVASRQLVPLNKLDAKHRGTLQRSSGMDIDRAKKQVTLWYQVTSEPDYALIQHETPEGPNWRHMRGRQWHYLSEPFEKMAPRLAKKALDATRRVMREWP